MRVQVDAYSPALFDDFGFREVHFIVFGRHDAVTVLFRLFKCLADAVVKFLRISKGSDIAHERKVVSDVCAAHFAEYAVEGALFCLGAYRRAPCSGFQLNGDGRSEPFALVKERIQKCAVAHLFDLGRNGADGSERICYDGRIGVKNAHPVGKFDIHGEHGEFIQYAL